MTELQKEPSTTRHRPRTRRRIFRMPDGKILRAHTFEELALKMREGAFFPGKDLNEYMIDVAKRVYIMHGVQIRSWNPDAFIFDLIHYKLVIEILVN